MRFVLRFAAIALTACTVAPETREARATETEALRALGVGPLPSGPSLFARYTPPEDSGLVAGRPFPNEGDVCVLLSPDAQTPEIREAFRLVHPPEGFDASWLACPSHERGAISDRVRGGFPGTRAFGTMGRWTLIIQSVVT
ncbi:MAG: hypothetical protein AAF618_14500 [Pseudomonadota bacterium]